MNSAEVRALTRPLQASAAARLHPAAPPRSPRLNRTSSAYRRGQKDLVQFQIKEHKTTNQDHVGERGVSSTPILRWRRGAVGAARDNGGQDWMRCGQRVRLHVCGKSGGGGGVGCINKGREGWMGEDGEPGCRWISGAQRQTWGEPPGRGLYTPVSPQTEQAFTQKFHLSTALFCPAVNRSSQKQEPLLSFCAFFLTIIDARLEKPKGIFPLIDFVIIHQIRIEKRRCCSLNIQFLYG